MVQLQPPGLTTVPHVRSLQTLAMSWSSAGRPCRCHRFDSCSLSVVKRFCDLHGCRHRDVGQFGVAAWFGSTRTLVQIQPSRLLRWHWIDVGVAHCLDSSNKILSRTIPSGISFVKTFQRTANPPPNTGEGTRQRARNDGNASPRLRGHSLLLGSGGIGKRSWNHACQRGFSRATVAAP